MLLPDHLYVCMLVCVVDTHRHTVLGRVTLIVSFIQDDSHVHVCMACTAPIVFLAATLSRITYVCMYVCILL